MKYLQYILITSLVFLTIGESYSTTQVPDYLIYEGDTVPIKSSPLQSYIDKYPNLYPIFEQFEIKTTNCFRGYIAYWELKNDSLFLIKIQGDTSEIPLSFIFDKERKQEKIFADWFDGSILAQLGKKFIFPYIDFSTMYEFEKELIFDNGKLKKTKQYDNSKSKSSKYSNDPILLSEFINQNMNKALLPDSINRIVVLVQINEVSESGKITNVTIERGYNSILDNEAMRVIKMIPEWDVVFSKGKRIIIPFSIPVVFDRKK